MISLSGRVLITVVYGDVRAIFLGLKSSLQAIFLGTTFYLKTSHVLGLKFFGGFAAQDPWLMYTS